MKFVHIGTRSRLSRAVSRAVLCVLNSFGVKGLNRMQP